MSEPCPRVGKLFGGCKFSPRYDTVAASGPTPDAAFWNSVVGDANRYTPGRKTYLCDVCETCGKTLFRRKPNTPRKSDGKP